MSAVAALRSGRLQLLPIVRWGLMALRNPGTHHRGRPTQGFRTCGCPGQRLQGPQGRLRLLQSPVSHAEKQRHLKAPTAVRGRCNSCKDCTAC